MASPSDDNPYLPSRVEAAPEQSIGVERPNISRGLRWGALWAAAGFIGVVVFLQATIVFDYWQGDSMRFELRRELFDFTSNSVFSIGHRAKFAAPAVALVLGMAGFLNYTPSQRLGVGRSVALVAAALVCGMILAGGVAAALGYAPMNHRVTREPHEELVRALVAASVPLLYTIAHTVVRCRKQATQGSSDSNDSPPATSGEE
jgi:hypothetical protein